MIGIVTGYFGVPTRCRSATPRTTSRCRSRSRSSSASQAPAAMSRDLRFRVAPLYFSRPLSAAAVRPGQVRRRWPPALFILVALPITILLRRRAAGGAAARRPAAGLPPRDGRRRRLRPGAGRDRAGRRGDDTAPRARGRRGRRRAAGALGHPGDRAGHGRGVRQRHLRRVRRAALAVLAGRRRR